jgi:DNA repair exonuclease SbcCD ATPase subunit
MIILQQLKWNNCFSYGEGNSIDLSETNLTQLVGTNGTGKSSIPIILEEVLFNKNSKGIKKADIVNRNLDTDTYSISLNFEVNGEEYRIESSRAKGLKVKLTHGEEDISSHTATNTYKQIESILGLDFKTFSQLIYQSTTSSLQFLTATDTTRKKFLIELLNLEKYIEMFNIFKDAHKAVAEEVSDLKGSISTISSWTDKHREFDTTKIDLKELILVDQDIQESLAVNKNTLKDIDSLNRKVVQNNQYKAIRDNIDFNELTKSPDEPSNYDEKVSEVGSLTGRIQAAKAVEAKLQKLGHSCPTCLQNINEEVKTSIIDEKLGVIKKAEQSISLLEQDIAVQKHVNTIYQEHKTVITKFEKYNNLIDISIPEEVNDKGELKDEIKHLEEAIRGQLKSAKAIEAYNIKATKHNTEVDYVASQLSEFIEDLEKKQRKLKNIQDDYAILEVLKKAFSTNGLVAYKIENLVKDLESLTNTYLGELSDGRFELSFDIANDKLNVIIIDDGVPINILALSSGEFARVNTAMLLAIRSLMATLSKTRINVLFLDEVINVLDDFGKEKLVEILLEEMDLNTFLVSHQWSHPLLNKVLVIKEKKISRLEEG